MGKLTDLLINKEERRLRSGWRLAYYILLFFGVYFTVGMVTAVITLIQDTSEQTLLLISTGLSAVGFTLITWMVRQRIDRRSFASLGLEIKRTSWQDLGFGVLLGAGLMGLIFVSQLAIGWLVVEGTAFDIGIGEAATGIMAALILMILVGYYEELVFRGYILQNLIEGSGLVWALLISSILFGGLHLINPNATGFSLASITGAGLLMAYGWIATGRLWLPIGLHIAWNFFQGAVFGFPVSGIPIEGLLHIQDAGPAWLTGGEFGPEGGLIVLPAMALGALGIWWYQRNTKITQS
jgi:membrane protease YdiL (CAAX protease family)